MTENDAAFIGYLAGLRNAEGSGALADLRRGLAGDPWNEIRMHRYVVPNLKDNMYPWDQKVYYMVAALFASHPDSGGMGDLGDSMERLTGKTGSQSMESRFIALLSAHQDDLFDQLRHAISLLKSKEIPVDWVQLCRDLRRWNDPDRRTQIKWSRSYWKSKKDEEE